MPPPNADTAKPIAYLTSEYPALSHTFIQREIAGLRNHGYPVLTTAVRRARTTHVLGQTEAEDARATYYLIEAGRNPGKLFGAFGYAIARPGRFLRAIRLAWKVRPPGLKAGLYQIFYLIEAMLLAHHLHKEGVRHLHNHFANSSCTVAMLMSEISAIPYSFTLHGPSIFFEPRRWRIDEKIARAKFVACISNFCRSQGMIFAAPEHWHKMQIVHCGVEPTRYQRQDIPPAKRMIFVGRLAAVKGVAVLLRAFARLRGDHPDAELVLIGDGDERPRLEALASELGLDKNVFVGSKTQDEVAEELSKSDLFVLASFAEGVPVVLMEAMASGLPVVTTRVAGIPELVEEGVHGLLVAPSAGDALEQAIRDLLDDPARRQAMGQAGQAKVAAEFDIATESRKIADLIDASAPA
ncbi:MAG: glycosyltransferase family 4 protein [Pseudomonadota bacterium]